MRLISLSWTEVSDVVNGRHLVIADKQAAASVHRLLCAQRDRERAAHRPTTVYDIRAVDTGEGIPLDPDRDFDPADRRRP